MSIWKAIDSAISESRRKLFITETRQTLSGGDINQAYCLSNKQDQFFVKVNTTRLEETFVAECVGLNMLANSKSFKIPKVIATGIFEDKAYLVLEFIEMSSTGDIDKFAQALANLHSHTYSSFGFQSDNFIGTNLQENNWCANWGDFFINHRLYPQLKKLEATHSMGQTKKLLDKIREFLNQHNPKSSLVHGDLWQGNISYTSDGSPVIYDPACYYADHEVDLAMLELFGNPGKKFFECYQQSIPIQSGYSLRREIYNLYHILNHANMFGGGYIQQSKMILDNIARLLNLS